MKKIFFILCITIMPLSNLFSQELKDVGSGVIDFLLSSPKSVNRMNADQQVALGIIGNLLKTAQERKHEINVAQAGKTEINLSTNTGQQIQLVMDANGNVFAVSNSMIYPISNNVVNQANDYITNQQPGYMDYVKSNSSPNNELLLSDYNIITVKKEWDKEKTATIQLVSLDKKPYYISDLEDIYEVKEEDFFIEIFDSYYPINSEQQITRKEKAEDFYQKFFVDDEPLYYPNVGGSFGKMAYWDDPKKNISHPVYVKLIDTRIRGTFTAKWLNDINGDGRFESDEFTDIRRNFYVNEPFVIAVGLYSQYSYKIKITILNQISGEIVDTDLLDNSGIKIDGGYFKYSSNTFKPGIYVYHISFIRSSTNEEIEKLTNEFQILAINQREKAGNIENPTINTNPSESSSKTKMINDLIQLLKEGKISEETFKASMKALENK